MSLQAWGGVLIIALVLVALRRGLEVRLVLLVSSFAMAALAGQAEQVALTFFRGLADPDSIVPICSAMGFAYVLREFGCDQHLVRALTGPLMRIRWLLIPGAIGVGFLVNIPIISQTGTALAVGTVLVPLLRSFGFSALVVGSALILGASIGGELLNPGAPELVTISTRQGISSKSLVPLVASLIFIHLAVAILVFCWLQRKEIRLTAPFVAAGQPSEPVHWPMAMVPLVPIILLFILGPPLELLHWPNHWILGKDDPAKLYSSRLIGLAMIIGVVVACLVVPRRAGEAARHFFDGAGYGYFHIISLIVVAKCFSEGIKLSGVTHLVGMLAEFLPVLLVPLAGLLPLLLAYLSGSGIGATQGLYPLLADLAEKHALDPLWLGVVTCIGSAAGRTMSPVAASVLLSAKLTDTTSQQLSRRVAPPLLAGVFVTIAIVMVMLG